MLIAAQTVTRDNRYNIRKGSDGGLKGVDAAEATKIDADSSHVNIPGQISWHRVLEGAGGQNHGQKRNHQQAGTAGRNENYSSQITCKVNLGTACHDTHRIDLRNTLSRP